jgi:hypothetical protein
MPRRQSTEAVKMRRLKKADFDVDFFFIGEVEFFPSPVEGARDCNSTPYLRWRNVNDYFTSALNFGIWLRY